MIVSRPDSKYQIIDTVITLKVYTDSGTITETYNVNDLLVVPCQRTLQRLNAANEGNIYLGQV